MKKVSPYHRVKTPEQLAHYRKWANANYHRRKEHIKTLTLKREELKKDPILTANHLTANEKIALTIFYILRSKTCSSITEVEEPYIEHPFKTYKSPSSKIRREYV